MSHHRLTYAVAAVALVGIAIGTVLVSHWPATGANDGEVLAEELAPFRDTDPALLKYRELAPIALPLPEPRAIAAGAGPRVWAAGGTTLVALDEGREARRLELDHAVTSVAVDHEGTLWVGATDHVERYDRDAGRIAAWPPIEGALLTSIAVDEDRVAVADAGNKIVSLFDRAGKLLARIGDADEEQGIPGFLIPSPYFDLAIDRTGQLWVVNPGRYELEAYTDRGDLRSSWGSASAAIEGFCGCCNPIHIATLANGSFVTAEKGIPRVKVYDPTGTLTAVVAGPEVFGEASTGFDLAVDDAGRVLVLDPARRQVRIFEAVMGEDS
jgi:hypothetical protein